MTSFLSLKDHVYNYISEKINEGSLQPNEKINEKSIMDDLNISRTPVREALIQLATEGYLENIPRKGFIVRPLNKKKARELYSILGVLDSFAANLSMELLSKEDMEDMNRLTKEMDKAISNYDFREYYQLQTNFHSIYINKCENEELIRILKLLKRSFIKQTYSSTEKEKLKNILYETNNEHKKIVEMFKEKDKEAIENYLRHVHWDPQLSYYDEFKIDE